MPNKDYPLISIGITSFNSLSTLPRAINSALNQDYPNKEIVIVDDGSKDGSIEYLQKLEKDYSNVKVIYHQKNLGCAGARNTIINNSSGDFLAFFDDDDESFKERISKQYNRIIKYETQHNEKKIFCYITRIVRKNEDANTDKPIKSIGYCEQEPYGEDIVDFILLNLPKEGKSWGQMGIGTSMIPINFLKHLGAFDQDFRRCEEWDLAVRAAFEGGHFISVDEPLMIQNITKSEDKAHGISLTYALMLRKKYKKYLKKKYTYFSSISAAHARFHYASGNVWKSRIWMLLSIIGAPHILLTSHIKRKIALLK